MDLDNVLNLKKRMLNSARKTTIDAMRTRGMRSAGFSPRSTPSASGIAFGVAPMGKKKQYRLAVRVMSQDRQFVEDVMQTMPDVKDEELDVVKRIIYTKRLTLRPGNSCGHYNITAGTLGAFVEDDEQYYMLSNNHILADSDNGHRGDDIWQPGPQDAAGGRHDVIGNLHRWVRFRSNSTGNIDAALARFTSEVSDFYPWRYSGIGDIDPNHITNRYDVDRVIKRGRTTEVTKGTVSAYSLDGVQIDYGDGVHPNVITFDNQIEVIHSNPTRWPFSQGGDSGSLIIDRDTMRPYALLFGGGVDENGIDRTLANFIPEVLDGLGVRFIQ